ncbi:MAG: SH3 domain-containing protein [Spirochaetales bacterium]|nr:SH3 domain-containing protein [Spirochaetales bacterium]
MKLNKIWVISIFLTTVLMSCSKYIGYGVVLLPNEDSDLESGALIKITKESRIRETWVYNTPEEDHIEIDKWRVEFYDNIKDAQEYIKNYTEYINYFVIVNRNSHSMRVKPFADSNLVYRLKKDQKVKVIGRTSQMEKIASFEGYWWHLITPDGVKGWSYDSYLSVYNGDEVIHSNVSDDSPEIHDFFKGVWRPRYFWTMERSRNIDLDKFKAKFKLTPDLDNKEITISMPDHYVTYKFTDFTKTGTNNYNLEGAPVQLDFSTNGMVTVIYSVDSKSYETNFIKMTDEVVNDIINAEVSTRKIKYNEFLFRGPAFNSKAYGDIYFNEDNTFRWTKRDNLITKQLLTSNAKSEGNVSFKKFMGKELKTKYDGIITFDFGGRQELSFLYTLEDNGIRFLYVPESKIEDGVVENDDFYTPIQMFFTGKF